MKSKAQLKQKKKVNKMTAIYTLLNNNVKNVWTQFSNRKT